MLLILQVQVILGFVFVQVHINDEAFLVMIVTFLEKFCLLYNIISCLSGCNSELHLGKFCSYVIVLVSMYSFCLVVYVSHQFFLHF